MLKNMKLWHILVIPKKKISTAQVYKKWDILKVKSLPLARPTLNKGSGQLMALTRPKYDAKILTLIGKPLFNSLEQVTAKLCPEVRRIKEKLIQMGVKSILMSGSGPAVFGIVSTRREGRAVCRQLKLKNRFWRVFVTRTI
jgi:4-diphosphocytidyl-2-C-methyl-D-erythritol kinase